MIHRLRLLLIVLGSLLATLSSADYAATYSGGQAVDSDGTVHPYHGLPGNVGWEGYANGHGSYCNGTVSTTIAWTPYGMNRPRPPLPAKLLVTQYCDVAASDFGSCDNGLGDPTLLFCDYNNDPDTYGVGCESGRYASTGEIIRHYTTVTDTGSPITLPDINPHAQAGTDYRFGAGVQFDYQADVEPYSDAYVDITVSKQVVGLSFNATTHHQEASSP